jgi:two-component system nitrate/nitrite response regulator NarL
MTVPIRVYAADDHPMFRATVARAIRRHPRLELVGEAADGLDALQGIRDLHPDVAIVDLQMPGLDGAQILEAVRAEKLVATRVILLSGQLIGETAEGLIRRGAVGVLSKLTGTTALTDAIEAVARGETVIAPDATASAHPTLSRREHDVLACVADGASVATIARELQLSPSTVKTHLEHVYRKLGVSDRAAAVAEAMRRGILR